MGPHTQVEGIVGEEERKFSTAGSAEEVVPARNAGAEFAATLSWLPERSSVEAFQPRGEKLARKLKLLVDRIDAVHQQFQLSRQLLAPRLESFHGRSFRQPTESSSELRARV